MDREGSKRALAPAGISIRNGPITGDKMDIDEHIANGKRKSRGSAATTKSYKELDSEVEDENIKPLVRHIPLKDNPATELREHDG